MCWNSFKLHPASFHQQQHWPLHLQTFIFGSSIQDILLRATLKSLRNPISSICLLLLAMLVICPEIITSTDSSLIFESTLRETKLVCFHCILIYEPKWIWANVKGGVIMFMYVYTCVYIHLIMCLYPLVADKLRYTRFPDFPPRQMWILNILEIHRKSG